MSTLSVTHGGSSRYITYTLTYNYTNTDATTATISLSRLSIVNDGYVGATIRVYLTVDGATLYSGTPTSTITLSGSKSFARKNDAYTVAVKIILQQSINGSWTKVAEKSATVSISPLPSYTIHFSNSGRGPAAPADISVQHGGYTTLPIIEYTNYTFDVWNTNMSGTGTSYAGNSRFGPVTQNISLYALWNHKISFNGNGTGVTYLPDDVVRSVGERVDYTGRYTPQRTGYEFITWNDQADGSGTKTFDASNPFMPDDINTIFYAQWQAAITSIQIIDASIKRVDDSSSTTESDDGEYAYLQIPFVAKGAAGGAVSMSVEVAPEEPSADLPILQPVKDTSTKLANEDLNDTFILRASNCSPDLKYTFSIRVTSSAGLAATGITLTLQDAFFTLDFLAGGRGASFGAPARRATLAVRNMPVEFGKDTLAHNPNQLAIGKCNVEDADDVYAFIIGTGSANSRFNGLAFTFDNEMEIGIDGTQTDIALWNAISTLGWENDVSDYEEEEAEEADPGGGLIGG